MITSIQLDKDVKDKIDRIKIHPRETYNEVIQRLIEHSSPRKIGKESLIATIEVLSDPETMRDIAEYLENIQRGDLGKSLDEIKTELK